MLRIVPVHLIVSVPLLAVALSGCYPLQPSDNYRAPDSHSSSASQPATSLLSYGMVKRALKPGKTTQAEVLQQFGAPNNMTYQANGEELWIYDQVISETTTQARNENSRLGFGLFGGSDSHLVSMQVGAGQYQGTAATRSTLKTLTVILSFDDRGILRELSARKGGY